MTSDDFSKVNVEVRIIPTISPSSPIQLQRLSPHRSNIRASTSTSTASELSTPLYNTALLLATVPRAHLLRVYALQTAVPAFSDALALLKVWAAQRGYAAGAQPCVRGFEGRGMWWAAVLDLLVHGEEPPAGRLAKGAAKRKPLGKGLSSYQLFRAALDFFCACRSILWGAVADLAFSEARLQPGARLLEDGEWASCMFLPLLLLLHNIILTIVGVSFRLMSMTDRSRSL